MNTDPDFGYLQHGTPPGPLRTERVSIKHTPPGRWHARYEGRWRSVRHCPLGKRLFIIYHGERITIQIDGV